MKTSMLLVALLVSAALAANEPDCGTKGPKSPNAVSRIIGGQDAKPHEFPWQCSLQLWKMHNCGASILNKRWLLTAGHCTSPDDQLEVLCGGHNLGKLEGTETRAKVIQVIRHPKYWSDMDTAKNDVALLKIDRDLPLDNPAAHLGSICLPDKEPLDRLADTSCIATGWGVNDAPVKTILQKVSLKIWKQDDCKRQWIKHKNTNITEGMICFGGHGKGVCNGDSGGPFNCFNREQGRWFSYGVTSFGGDTCISEYPDVDTRLSTYSKWIWQMIEQNS